MKYLIVGLGNPGKDYERTRHNVGFMVVDALKEKDHSNIFILKPKTFMNESGNEVAPFMKMKNISNESLIVVHDELDIPFGEVRVQTNRSAAGHNGVQSIIDSIGTQDFTRVRVGIGPRPENIPGDKFVLQRFSSTELKELEENIIPAAVEAIEKLLV